MKETLIDSDCPGGRAEPVNRDASRCSACGYTFTTVPNDPTVVPPHWRSDSRAEAPTEAGASQPDPTKKSGRSKQLSDRVDPLVDSPWVNPDGSTNVDGWLAAYAEDDNTFWRTESGHIMNVVDELIARLEADHE